MANKKGMDICYHQGDIDFVKAKAAGMSFIIPRDGWGEYSEKNGTKLWADPKFHQYVKDALAAGVEVPGVYHFIYASNEAEARLNAKCAIKNVKDAGLPKSTIIWCDYEYDSVDNARDYRGVDLSTAMQRKITEAFCDTVLADGYPTGIYTNRDFIVRVYGTDILKKYDLWLADLEGDADYPCLYRQVDWYGKYAGCPTNVDVDEFYGTYTVGTAKPQTSSSNNTTTSTTQKGDYMIKASTLLANIHDVVDNIPTVYEQGANWGAWNGSAYRLDCIIFIKCMVYWDWYKPSKTAAHGGASYNANYDWTEPAILQHCSNVQYGNFLSAKPCAYLYMDGHGGFKIDEFTKNGKTYNVAECTWAAAWGTPAKCVYSYVDNNGYRYSYKGGVQAGKWEAHGELYGVEYDVAVGQTVTATTTPTKTAEEVAKEIVAGTGGWGNGQARKNNLEAAGYNYSEVQSIVNQLVSAKTTTTTTFKSLDMAKFVSFLPDISKGDSGDMVKLLQACLKEKGYYTDAIDGSAGGNTDTAIRTAQKAMGLTVDGSFGPKCWTKLLIG